jgi:hypothetical protein
MSETINNYSNKDFSKILMDRIYNLESNIVNLQKAIDNLQYNHSIQSSQAHLIKIANNSSIVRVTRV